MTSGIIRLQRAADDGKAVADPFALPCEQPPVNNFVLVAAAGSSPLTDSAVFAADKGSAMEQAIEVVPRSFAFVFVFPYFCGKGDEGFFRL